MHVREGQSLRLHSYVVARDYGFAPNPFYGFCTLATCKPEIRRTAKVEDWVVGTGSKEQDREGRIVYAMRVSETPSFSEYWKDERFRNKRPNLRGSKKQAFGDNIYHKDAKTGRWRQQDSHHSLPDGTPNKNNIAHDTRVDRILVGDEYVYWGGNGPLIPKRFRNYQGHDLCTRRGHKNKFPDKMVNDFIAWLRARDEKGYCGDPLDWAISP